MLRKLSMAQKIRAAAALVLIFLLVLATNMIDNHHFQTVKKSLNTVYEDRLVAKIYLYKINRQLQAKRHSWDLDNTDKIKSINEQANDSIDYYIEKFAATKLTDGEANLLQSLNNNLKNLFILEREVIKSDGLNANQEIKDQYASIYNKLDALSQIQLEEGKREIINSNRAIATSDLISKIEMGFLVLIGFLIQLLIFIKPMK